MNTQTVSTQTARLLADASFPQPAPAPGQWWGNGGTLVFVWRAWIDDGHNYFIVSQTVADGRPIIDDYFDARDFTGLVYLPTVGDILREMGERYSINIVDEKYWTIHREKHTSFGEPEYDYITESYPIKDHKSEHEAAALAWLELNKK